MKLASFTLIAFASCNPTWKEPTALLDGTRQWRMECRSELECTVRAWRACPNGWWISPRGEDGFVVVICVDI